MMQILKSLQISLRHLNLLACRLIHEKDICKNNRVDFMATFYNWVDHRSTSYLSRFDKMKNKTKNLLRIIIYAVIIIFIAVIGINIFYIFHPQVNYSIFIYIILIIIAITFIISLLVQLKKLSK